MALYTPAWYRIFYAGLMFWFTLSYQKGALLSWQNALLIVVVVVALAMAAFILQSIGLYKLAKKNGANRVWLAFVPFANSILIEELSGEVTFFGRKVRRLGVFTMIVRFLSMLYHIFLAYALYILFIENGALYYEEEYILNGVAMQVPAWQGLTGTAAAWLNFYNLGMIASLIGLAEAVVLIMLYSGFYKRYVYKNATFFVVLGLIIPFFHEIATFCIRKRERINYEAILRARREAYMRQQQQWQNQSYGNPYGPYGPYGNPYGNPYARPQGSPEQKPKPEEPFAEFSDEPFGEFSSASRASSVRTDSNQENQGGQNGAESSRDDDFFS